MKLSGDQCACSVCHLYFNSTYAFDKHRSGPWIKRRCLSIPEMLALGMEPNRKGLWISHKKADPSAPGMQSSGDRPDVL